MKLLEQSKVGLQILCAEKLEIGVAIKIGIGSP